MADSKPTQKYSLDDLKYLMARLRDPERGCPWDIKQTFQSIVPHTLEEAYEVADAIERGDRTDMRDELGDLLFQVVFYARMAEEEGSFDFEDICSAITNKLLRRHPHVFPDRQLHAFHPEATTFTEDQIKGQWDAIKAEERALKAKQTNQQETHSLLDDIPKSLPSLVRAEKIQRRAAQVGFDWDAIDDVFAKLEEEIGEVREVLQSAKGQDLREPALHERLNDEMGDVLFCGVNLARFLKVHPDEALRTCNDKFSRRFGFIEQSLKEQNKSFEECSLAELDALWNKAKNAL